MTGEVQCGLPSGPPNSRRRFTRVTSQATLAAVALFGGYMVVEGSLGLAELAACTLLSGRAIQPMLKLTSLWVQAENVAAAENR